MQWIVKDEQYKATNPVKEDSHQAGMLVKNDNQNNFSLSENKKSRRQEESSKKIFRSNQGLLTKMMILTLAVVRCTSAKSIDGLILKNEIREEHAPGSYDINHDKDHKGNNVKIEEEVIQAYNCKEGGTASAKISLNPPPKCSRADGSAYEAPNMKRAQILEKVKKIL